MPGMEGLLPPCPPPSLVQQVQVWPSPRGRQLLLQLQDAQPDVPRGQQQGHHPGDRAVSEPGGGSWGPPGPGGAGGALPQDSQQQVDEDDGAEGAQWCCSSGAGRWAGVPCQDKKVSGTVLERRGQIWAASGPCSGHSSTEGPAHLCLQPPHPLLSLLPPAWLGSPPLHPTGRWSLSAWGAGGGPGVPERPLRSPVAQERLFGCPRGAARACRGVGAAAHPAAPGGCRAPRGSPPGPTGSRSAGGQALVAGHHVGTQGRVPVLPWAGGFHHDVPLIPSTPRPQNKLFPGVTAASIPAAVPPSAAGPSSALPGAS